MMIEGVPQTMERLRREYGLKIGSSTGYTSEIMKKLKVFKVIRSRKFFFKKINYNAYIFIEKNTER